MTAFNPPISFGPGNHLVCASSSSSSVFSGMALNDIDNSMAIISVAPKNGTINSIGIKTTSSTGNPPLYSVGLYTVDSGTGIPTTGTYGGSAVENYYFTGTSWTWVTLSTPATAQVGDIFAVRILPAIVTPSGANCISVPYDNILYSNMPYSYRYTTSWTKNEFATAMAARYTTGEIVGLPAVSFLFGNVDSGTNPNEVGNKFILPSNMKCIGAKIYFKNRANESSVTIKLYDSLNNVLASFGPIDEDVSSGNTATPLNVYWSEVQLIGGQTYRITIVPGNTNDMYTAAFDFDSEASKNNIIPDGQNWTATYRTNAGSWTDSSSGIVLLSLLISDITFSSAASGGVSKSRLIGGI